MLPLQTNNPRKMQVLEELGVNVTGRIPCIVESQELNVGYLATKQVCSRSGTHHVLPHGLTWPVLHMHAENFRAEAL